MTERKNLKRRVRARAAKTGESYTAALRHVRPTPTGTNVPVRASLRIAVAQSTVRGDPTKATLLRQSGSEVRNLMKDAARAGARLVHFTEGAICFPDKRVMSSLGPADIGASDWSKAHWSVLQEELDRVAALSGELGIWTVIPSVHQQPGTDRPFNSAYVVSDRGAIVARYDERMLSTTKASWMYAAGTQPVTFDVDGYRVGIALGLDVLFPELFRQYDELGVDVVLVSYASTDAANETVPIHVRGHAVANTFWIGLAAPAHPASNVVSGLIDPHGIAVAECPACSGSTIAVTDIRPIEISQIGRVFRSRTRARSVDVVA
jgi:predicted amidohydrolase